MAASQMVKKTKKTLAFVAIETVAPAHFRNL